MSTGQVCSTPCETCKKEGLPLLLARYAVHTSETKAPALTGKLGDAALDAIPLGSHAQYGLRLLRSGYVYVFDEARKHWDEYFVTSDGFLTKLPPRPKTGTRAAPATNFACARSGAAPLAGVITIRNPKHATNIWIGFSDVEWTDETLGKHGDAAYRQRHMQKVTVSNGKVAPQAHTAALENVDAVVPEFKLDANTIKKQIAPWSPFPFNSRVATVEDFKAAVHQARPQGGAAVVVLFDPAGVLTELATLMETQKRTCIGQPDLQRPMSVSGTIASLENSLREQAKLAEILAGEELAKQAEAGPGTYNPNPALWGVGGDYEAAENWRNISPAHLQSVADKTWKKYTHKANGQLRFNDDTRLAWQKNFNASLKKFDAEFIAPLAKAYVKWLTSGCLQENLACNFDVNNIVDGAAYTTLVCMMLKNTGDKQACHDLYTDWLTAGDLKATNLLMRALTLNQEDFAGKIQEANETSIDSRILPTDATLQTLSAGLTRLPPAAQAKMGELLDILGGAIIGYLGKLEAGKAKPAAAAALFGMNGRQMMRLEIKGNRGKFVQKYVEAVGQLEPNLRANKNQLQKAVAAQVRLMEIEGLKMNVPETRRWFIILDKNVVKGVPAQASGQAWANEIAKAIRAPDQLDKIDQAAWKRMIGGEMRIGILAGLLQIWNMTKTAADYTNAMSHERPDAGRRFYAGCAAIGGTFTEQAGLALERLAPQMLKNAQGLWATGVPTALKVVGRGLGFVGAVAVGVADFFRSGEEEAKGNFGLAGLYFWSGVLGIGLGFLLLVMNSIGPIGWIITACVCIAFIVVTVLIEKEKDNKIQEWLARCHFGLNADKYASAEVEQKQLDLALQ